MKRPIILLSLVMLMAANAHSQQIFFPTVEDDSILVGTITTNASTQIPVNSDYKYSLTQQIYPASAINHPAAELNAIDFYLASGDSVNRAIKVWVKNLDDSQNCFASASQWFMTDSSDIVFTGLLTAADSGRVRITFDHPFAYNGGNLLVMVSDTTGQRYSWHRFHVFYPDQSSQIRSHIAYHNSTRPTLDNLIGGSYTGNQATQSHLAIASFHFTPADSSVVVADKVYDGTSDASVTLGQVSGIAAGDDVQVVASARFATANAGTQQVFVTFSLTGNDTAGYLPPADDTLAATIHPRQLTISGTEVSEYKIYDGSASCAITVQGTIAGLVGSDSADLTATASFANASKEFNKPVVVSYVLGANDSNYTAPANDTLVSNIVSDSILVTLAVSDAAKGSTTPVPGSYVAHIGDTLSPTPAANAGYMFRYWVLRLNGTVVDTDYTATPQWVFDYTLCDSQCSYTAVFDTLHDVLPVQFACNGTGEGFIYNAYAPSRNLCGQALTADSAQPMAFQFAAGENSRLRSLLVNGNERIGDLDSLSVLRLAITDTTMIAPVFDSIVTLSVSGTLVATAKDFDNTDTAQVITPGTLQGVASGDNVVLNAEAHYCQTVPGNHLAITVDYSLSGEDCEWYRLSETSFATNGNISPKQLTVTGSYIDDKVYDGTTQVPRTSLHIGTTEGKAEGTTVHCAFAPNPFNFANANAGENIPVIVSYTVSGSDAFCYLAPANDTLSATILPKQLSVVNVQMVSSKIYDGNTDCQVTYPGDIFDITAVVPGDTLYPISTNSHYMAKNAGEHVRIISSFAFNGPQGRNYTAGNDSTHYGIISPMQITVSGCEVQLAKEYDGTDSAIVISNAKVDTLIAGDDLAAVTRAYYNDSLANHSKSIFVHHSLTGADSANYRIADYDSLYSFEGKIVMPTQLDTIGEEGELLLADADGYCQGNSGIIRYHIAQGDPVEYKIFFSEEALAQGFSNSDWTTLPDDEQISFDIPDYCPNGQYSTYVVFRNEAFVESDTMGATFIVNLGSSFMVQLYDDLISIDNSRGLFNSYQWYRNGEPIAGANEPYYQEKGGLRGSYFVRVNLGTTDEARTCEMVFEPKDSEPSIQLYPNPIATTSIVKLQDFAEGEHLMKLFNAYGVELMSMKFSGTECRINMSRLPQGSYMVNVDGLTAKAMKL